MGMFLGLGLAQAEEVHGEKEKSEEVLTVVWAGLTDGNLGQPKMHSLLFPNKTLAKCWGSVGVWGLAWKKLSKISCNLMVLRLARFAGFFILGSLFNLKLLEPKEILFWVISVAVY